MHGMPPAQPAKHSPAALSPRLMLPLFVAINGTGPIFLYMLVPALPVLAAEFGRDISIAQMTVSFYMVGLAISQMVMGPLSDHFGRRPILLAGLGLSVIAAIACIFATTLPQLIVARFFQALGSAGGMVIGRAIIRDIYSRERVGSMFSLVTAVQMIAQMLSPLIGGLLDTRWGWSSIFYLQAGIAFLIVLAIALVLPETRRVRAAGDSFLRDIRQLATSRAYIGYMLCTMFGSQIVFAFAGGGPYIVISHMGRSSAEYGAWFATTGFAYLLGSLLNVRFAPRHSLEKLIWLGLTLQFFGSALNLVWSITGVNELPMWLFLTQTLVYFGNSFVLSNALAVAFSIRPQTAGTAAGVAGFVQMGVGALFSQLGAYLGGHFSSTMPLMASLLALSLACASSAFFLVPRRKILVTKKMLIKAEEDSTPI